MLQQKQPSDFVIATGESHTVKEFAKLAFDHVGLNWKKYVKVDQKLYRPAEVTQLTGNSARARRVLGWKPRVDLGGLVRMMVDADIKRVEEQIRRG
jgi:GDPmannose 4,6-dehydratase